LAGHRGQPFKTHASVLPFNDWHAAKSLLLAMAEAIDKLEDQVYPQEPDNADSEEQ